MDDADVHSVSSKFHKAFDVSKWLLLPETWIIDAYYNATSSHKFPNIEECNLFNYPILCG